MLFYATLSRDPVVPFFFVCEDDETVLRHGRLNSPRSLYSFAIADFPSRLLLIFLSGRNNFDVCDALARKFVGGEGGTYAL